MHEPPDPVDNLWIIGKPAEAPQAILGLMGSLIGFWGRLPQRAAATPKRTGWPASRRPRSVSGSRSDTALAPECWRPAPARPPCRAGRPDISLRGGGERSRRSGGNRP